LTHYTHQERIPVKARNAYGEFDTDPSSKNEANER